MNAGHKKAPGHEPLSCRGTISHFLLFSVVIDQAAFEDDLALVIGELVHFQGDLFQAVACNVAGELAGFVLDGCRGCPEGRGNRRFLKGSSPSSMRKGSIPQLIRLER